MTTTQQAKLLLDPEHYGLLQLLMRANTLETGIAAAEVARDLGWTLQTAHYKLGRLVEAEIAVVSGEEKRAGRAVKRYSSVRPAWFVPFDLTPADTLGELIAAQLDPRMRRIYDRMAEEIMQISPHRGVTFKMQEGMLTVHLAPPDLEEADAPPITASLSSLKLSPGRAREFHGKLIALAQEFIGTPDEGGEHYILGTFFIRGNWE